MRRQNRVLLPPWWAVFLLAPISYFLLAQLLPRWQPPNPYLHLVFTSAAPALVPFITVGLVLMAAALGGDRWQRRQLLD